MHPFQLARPIDQPHCQVEIGFGEVRILVCHDVELDFGVRCLEAGEPCAQPLGVELARHGYRVAIGGLARLHCLHAFLELQEAFAQRIKPGTSFAGQLQPFAGTTKQNHAEMVFQRANLLAYGSGRDRQLVCRAREGEMPSCGIVNAQGIQRQVSPLHGEGDLGCWPRSRKRGNATPRPANEW